MEHQLTNGTTETSGQSRMKPKESKKRNELRKTKTDENDLSLLQGEVKKKGTKEKLGQSVPQIQKRERERERE